MEVFVRAAMPVRRPKTTKTRRAQRLGPSKFTLIFDTETTTDASQRLRFGTFQLRVGPKLAKAGVFYEPAELSSDEIALLREYTRRHRLELLTRDEFITDLLVGVGHRRRARIVTFNQAFDLSRLRIDHDTARGRNDQDPFAGGFTFKIHESQWVPRIRLRKTTDTSCFVEFTVPDGRHPNKRGHIGPAPRGFFVDVATIAAAMLGHKHSLQSLCETLNTETKKQPDPDHGEALTTEYLDYAMADTQATWECFATLKARWRAIGLETHVPLHRLHSEASITKGLLKALGITPWLRSQPDAPDHLIAKAMESYYGGRTQIGVRHHPVPQVLVDFTSQYPAVFALQGLWDFITATETRWQKPPLGDVRRLIASLDADTLLRPETWPKLNMLVKVAPDADLLPTRARFAPTGQPNVALCYRSGAHQWFTLADIVVAKLLNGRTPKVTDAVALEAGEPQSTLTTAHLGVEDSGQQLDPAGCVPVALVEARARLRQDTHTSPEGTERAVKAAVNSLYGVGIELNAITHAQARDVNIVKPNGNRYLCRATRTEHPGTYYQPIVATLVAGGGRLLLGLLQHVVEAKGGTFGFCDTDSLSIVATRLGGLIDCPGGPHELPDGTPAIRALSHRHVDEIVHKLNDLNPYHSDIVPSFLKIENGTEEEVWLYGISAKRYVLFTRGTDGSFARLLPDPSQHGLGHITPPRGLTRSNYHDQVWTYIVRTALAEDPAESDWLDQPALGRLTATTPSEIRNFDSFNHQRPYERRLGPMNFVAIAHPHPTAGHQASSGLLVAPFGTEPSQRCWIQRGRGREPTAITTIHPMYLIEGHTPVLDHRYLIASHAAHPEAKALDSTGRHCDGASHGLLRPRHIEATTLIRCGKEANRYADDPVSYDPLSADGVGQYEEPLCESCGSRIDHRSGRRFCDDACRKRSARAQRPLTTA